LDADQTDASKLSQLPTWPLPSGLRSRRVPNVNGLDIHILEAGSPGPGVPCLLLLHGFPELSFSWRNIMPALANAGYYVVAPDQRGYGRTTGWDGRYEADLSAFRMVNLSNDMVALVHALGLKSVAGVIGHDFGSPVAAWCALLHPQIFLSVVLMSAPFGGPPGPATGGSVHEALAALVRPRKHYQWYYSTPQANADMLYAPQGLQAFLRAYYHAKSADWKGNVPRPLTAWQASELAKLPSYYVMDLHQNMAETVIPYLPNPSLDAACAWLPDEALEVYAAEYARTGFQGGLQWYRCGAVPSFLDELRAYQGRKIKVPAGFIAGSSDWGIYQKPGEFERMQSSACEDFRFCALVPGAGHWVQQEQAFKTCQLLLDFLNPQFQ
jgi:pimeloyl-ACP methyl ester carboxylesterase